MLKMTKDQALQATEILTFKNDLEPHPSIFSIYTNDEVVLEFMRNGDIFVKGKLVENNQEVVNGVKEWLRDQGYFYGQ